MQTSTSSCDINVPLVLTAGFVIMSFSLFCYLSDADPEGEPSKHDGRIRTFSHFPGNWAMHVFIPCEYISM